MSTLLSKILKFSEFPRNLVTMNSAGLRGEAHVKFDLKKKQYLYIVESLHKTLIKRYVWEYHDLVINHAQTLINSCCIQFNCLLKDTYYWWQDMTEIEYQQKKKTPTFKPISWFCYHNCQTRTDAIRIGGHPPGVSLPPVQVIGTVRNLRNVDKIQESSHRNLISTAIVNINHQSA